MVHLIHVQVKQNYAIFMVILTIKVIALIMNQMISIGVIMTESWNRVWEECAGLSTQQSPINIVTSNTLTCDYASKDLDVTEWSISDGKTEFEINNNGHTIELSNPSDEYWHSEITFANGDVYCFHSIHFHWNSDFDHGSEHSIDDKFFALEAHMVHYYCRDDSGDVTYANKSEAVNAFIEQEFINGNDFVFAVADLLLDGDDSAPIHNGLKDLIKSGDLSYHEKDHDAHFIQIDLTDWVPEQYRDSSADYYGYKGSLTTPPCLSTVKFIIFTEHVTINFNQLQRFEDKTGLPENHRPTQPQK
eukprot:77999_1